MIAAVLTPNCGWGAEGYTAPARCRMLIFWSIGNECLNYSAQKLESQMKVRQGNQWFNYLKKRQPRAYVAFTR